MWDAVKAWGSRSDRNMWLVIAGTVLCVISALALMVGGVILGIAGHG